MKERVKMFYGNLISYTPEGISARSNIEYLEKEINEWLKNEKLIITRVMQSMGDDQILVSIFYVPLTN